MNYQVMGVTLVRTQIPSPTVPDNPDMMQAIAVYKDEWVCPHCSNRHTVRSYGQTIHNLDLCKECGRASVIHSTLKELPSAD